MKVLSEKELIKIQAKGGKALDASGKVIIPRINETEKSGASGASGAKNELDSKPDAVLELAAVMKQNMIVMDTSRQRVEVLLLDMIQRLSALPSKEGPPAQSPVHSWRFEIKRNGEGFIQEITARPVGKEV